MHCPGFFVSAVGIFDSTIKFPRSSMTVDRDVTFYEFEFFTADTDGTAFIGEHGYPMTYGTCICAKPGQVRHSILPFRCHYFHIEVADRELDKQLRSLPDTLNLYQMSEVKTIFRSIMALTDTTSLENRLLLESYICQILSMVLKAAQANADSVSTHSESIMAAEHYIRSHLNEELSLATVAAVCNLSPTYFHRLFTQFTGKTPSRYILDCRISAAKTRLLRRTCILSEIAADCGFSSQSYFCYKFKQETGLSPLQYRKETLGSLDI